jgi:orotidine-5'-phosphate decarboxylase
VFESARDRLCVGLDVPSLARAEAALAAFGTGPGWLKVGSELFGAAGPAAVRVAAARARVFLDLKLHDIPNTVARAVRAASAHGASMLTLHTAGGSQMLRAALDAAAEAGVDSGSPRPLLVGVTVLTSMGEADLKEVGVVGGVGSQVARLVDLAQEAGLDGVVASPGEAAAIRARVGSDFRIVTPGIRPADWSGAGDDQTRVATAQAAAAAGADLVVVARPVLQAPDPAAAIDGLVAEIEAGLGARPA